MITSILIVKPTKVVRIRISESAPWELALTAARVIWLMSGTHRLNLPGVILRIKCFSSVDDDCLGRGPKHDRSRFRYAVLFLVVCWATILVMVSRLSTTPTTMRPCGHYSLRRVNILMVSQWWLVHQAQRCVAPCWLCRVVLCICGHGLFDGWHPQFESPRPRCVQAHITNPDVTVHFWNGSYPNQQAIAQANPHDIVIVAGKGEDPYQRLTVLTNPCWWLCGCPKRFERANTFKNTPDTGVFFNADIMYCLLWHKCDIINIRKRLTKKNW